MPFRNRELSLRARPRGVRAVILSREIIGPDGERVNFKQFYDITERKQNEKQLMDASQQVMSDSSWFSQKVMQELAQVRIGDREPTLEVALSRREVLKHVAWGAGNVQITTELGTLVQTVRNYVSNLYSKPASIRARKRSSGRASGASPRPAIIWDRRRPNPPRPVSKPPK